MTTPGWATDLAVLELSGSTIEDRGDHLVVRTPHNPTFHWGNFVLVTDPEAGDDADRWLRTFQEAHPLAAWVAIGLQRLPAVVGAWTELGLAVGLDDVLTTRALPRQTPLAAGYTVRPLDGDDWEQHIAREVADNLRSGEYEPVGHERFVRARTRAERDLCERGVATFVGAFTAGDGDGDGEAGEGKAGEGKAGEGKAGEGKAGEGKAGEGKAGVLVADLGIVVCGRRARYQNVGTHEAHRRRGLASHLLGVAARWAADQGCDEWVIVTEAVNPAGRVYRSVGFTLDAASVQAYRPPAR